jgi:TonB family protein
MQKTKLFVGAFILLCLLAVTFAQTEQPSTPSYEPPTVVSTVEPVYPALAIGSGTIVLEVSIDAAGEIQDVKVIKDTGGFKPQSLDAIKQWKFKPATLNGKPIPSVLPVAFSFTWPIACR